MRSEGSFLQAIHTLTLARTVLSYVGCTEETTVEILAAPLASDEIAFPARRGKRIALFTRNASSKVPHLQVAQDSG